MNKIGVSNFSLKDIIKPTRKRLIVFLSELINVIKFRELMLEGYQSCLQESVSLK